MLIDGTVQPCTHGGTVITACDRHHANNGRPIARVGDLHRCPLPGHGVTQIVSDVSVIGGIVENCVVAAIREQMTRIVPPMVERALLEGGSVVSTDYRPVIAALKEKKAPTN